MPPWRMNSYSIKNMYFFFFSTERLLVFRPCRNFVVVAIKNGKMQLESWSTDYEHTRAKSLFLCSSNSNHLGCGYKSLVSCRNNVWIMETMDRGFTLPKWVLIVWRKYPKGSRICLPKPKSFKYIKKASLASRSPWFGG